MQWLVSVHEPKQWVTAITLAEMVYERYTAEVGDHKRWKDQSDELKRAWILAIHETIEILKKALLA